MTGSADRVAISGMGIVSAFGEGMEAFLQALRDGRQGFSKIPVRPLPHGKDNFAFAAFDTGDDDARAAAMAVASAREALDHAQAAPDPARLGVIVGTVWGDTTAAENLYPDLAAVPAETSWRRLPVGMQRSLDNYPIGRVADHVADAIGAAGPRVVVSNACASGNIAMGLGQDLIRSGACDAVLALGVDRFSLTGLWGAERSGFVGREVRPFDKDRRGTVLGEGAASVLLERGDCARRIQGWMEGWSISCEPGAAAITLREDGLGLRISMSEALAEAGRDPADVALISAHAPGTPLIDIVECRAVAALWPDPGQRPAVNALKGMTGHMSGASGVAEAIACLLQMNAGFIHGNSGLVQPDPELPVTVMPAEPQRAQVELAVSNACGGGGLNTSVTLAAPHVRPAGNVPRQFDGEAVITGLGAFQAPGRTNDPDAPPWFDIDDWFARETQIGHMNRSGQIGAIAGVLAVRDSGLAFDADGELGAYTAVMSGAWLGGWPTASTALCEGLGKTPVEIYPSTALDNGCHLGSMIVARQYGLTGPTVTFCGSISAGLQALASAADFIRMGRARAGLVLGYDSDHVMMRRAAGWASQCPPLHDFVEGGGGAILERADAARRRGASIHAYIRGSVSLSAPLGTAEDVNEAAQRITSALGNRVKVVVLTPPRDDGMQQLAQALSRRMGAHLEVGSSIHSAAAQPLIALSEIADRAEEAVVLAGGAGTAQVALRLSAAPSG